MTAPNTPTPEVEREALVGKLWAMHGIAQSSENGFTYLNDAARVVIAEAADAISRLTAERDAMERELNALKINSSIAAQRSKSRIADLEASRSSWIESCKPLNKRALDAEASNKLLSERVAVLETALEPFARYASDPFDKDHKGYPFPDGQGVGWVYLTHADFRRALAAREAK